MTRSSSRAALIACWTLGLLLDLASSGPIGCFAFAFGLVGLGIVGLRASLFRDHLLSHFFLALVFGMIANEVVVLRDAIGGAGWSWRLLFLQPAGNAVYTAIVAPYVMLLLLRLRGAMHFPARV
jgi:rod shape-determining protein MreD